MAAAEVPFGSAVSTCLVPRLRRDGPRDPAGCRVRARGAAVEGLFRFLLKRRGDRRWDLLVRATGAVALAGMPVVLLFPQWAPLVWFALLAVPANGPLSPILPAAFEPLIMEAVKYQAALWVTLVALGIYLYTEYLNWHLYAWVLSWARFSRLPRDRWVRWGLEHFGQAPFRTVVIFAVTPLPFWIVRAVAILHRYPVTRFLLATAVGRLPRYAAYAWLGDAFRVPTLWLLGVVLGTGALAVLSRWARGRRVVAEPVLDPGGAPSERGPSPELLG